MKRPIRALGAALLFLCLASGSAFAATLAERVMAELMERAPDLTVEILNDDQLAASGPDGSFILSLNNLRARCERQPAACDEAIAGFVDTAMESAGAETERGFPRDELYPLLRPEGFLPPGLVVSRPFVPGLVVTYVRDSPASVEYIKQVDLETIGLSANALHALTLRNAAALPPADLTEIEDFPGIFVLSAEDGLISARLFDPVLLDELERELGGPVALAVPARDWVLATRLDTKESVTTLAVVTALIAADAPDAISATVFRRDGAGWAVVVE